jgi:hypothetical protein
MMLSHANVFRAMAYFEHSNFFKVTAPEARPGQLRPGAHRRQKGRVGRCSPVRRTGQPGPKSKLRLKRSCSSSLQLIPFSAFWLRSSVVSVFISLISDTWVTSSGSPFGTLMCRLGIALLPRHGTPQPNQILKFTKYVLTIEF